MTTRIFVGDCREVLAGMPDNWYHVCVTSPPYWGLRDYGTEGQVWGGVDGCDHSWGDELPTLKQENRTPAELAAKSTLGIPKDGTKPRKCTENNQQYLTAHKDATSGQFCHRCNAWRGNLGLEPTPELYVQHMVEVMREVRRVLRDDGTVWLNLGDSFASGKGTCYNPGGGATSLGQERKAAGAHPLNRGNKSTLARSGLKPKDLVGIPWRVALALQADGWWLRSDIIWHKPNCMPESVTDRPTKSHEYIFLLTKSARYYFDADAVRQAHADTSWASKLRQNGRVEQQGPKAGVKATTTDQAHVRGNPRPEGGRNIRTVWTIPTRSFKGAHFATFPPALVTPCIKAGSSERGCCPECGAGWVRCVEKIRPTREDIESKSYRGRQSPGSRHIPGRQDEPQQPMHKNKLRGQEWAALSSNRTTGWQPTCGCYDPAYQQLGYTPDTEGFTFPDRETCTRAEALSLLSLHCADFLPPVPCRILDPFGGAGTTAIVARQLGRDCDLIELNSEYAAMAQQRLDATPVHTVETDTGEVEVQQIPMFSEVTVQ